MLESGTIEQPHRALKKTGIGIRILAEFATGLTQKKLGVFFVGQAVRRDMFWPKRDRFLQGRFPLREGLSGKSKHQIHVEVGKTSLTQNLKRSFRLGRVMFAAEQLQ